MVNFMKKAFELLTKTGAASIIVGGITLDGYRRQILSDQTKKNLDETNKMKTELDIKQKDLIDQEISLKTQENSLKVKLDNLNEARKQYEESLNKYQGNINDYNKYELDKASEMLKNASNDITNSTTNLGIGDFLSDALDKYYEYLSHLTPDKTVALFNIILLISIFYSFFTVISIILSQQAINKFKFLDNY